ncbi:MAG: hypothetical protein NW224_14275 [Leptolyngbyaceae cyanobacterium bins.302]|nr:hypothetical protein [Leptolyngbyaceae cyanobacterium bins.302]
MGSIHAVFLLVLVIAAQIAPLFNREQSGHSHHHHHEHHQTISSKRKRKQR